MNGLNGLFGGMGEYQDDLVKYATIGLSAAAANIAWAKLDQATTIGDTWHPAVKPAIKVIAGVVLAPLIPRVAGRGKIAQNVAVGVGAGLVGSGVVGLVNAFSPGLIPSIAGLADDNALLLADGFAGDNVYAERLNGADVRVDRVQNFAGVESVFSTGM